MSEKFVIDYDLEELEEENEQLKSERRNDAKELSALFRQNFGLKRENEQLIEENKQLHYKIIELQDKLGMSEKVIGDE